MIAELVTALAMLCPSVPKTELKQDAQVLVAASMKYRVEASLLAAVMVRESTCRRWVANARTGAGGLMGILRRVPNETYVQNIHTGAKLLAEYRDRCGNRGFALTSYNRGPNGGKNCRVTSYAEEVLEFERRIAAHLPVSS